MNQAGVMIHKMHLTGDLSQKNAFMHSLDNQSWIGEGSQKIIFIKKISVKGQWWELAGKIVQESNQWMARNSYDNDQIAFDHYAQMAAEFIAELLSGNKPWYLESWLQQQHLSAEPVAILIHKLHEIPSILNYLQETKSESGTFLSNLFLSLHVSDLQKLQQALVRLNPGFNFPECISLDDEIRQSIKLNLSKSSEQWIKKYLVAVVRPQSSKKEIEIILSIISCLSIWRFAPHLSNDIEGFQVWHSQVHQLYSAIFHSMHGDAGSEQFKTNLTLTLPFVRGGDKLLPLSEGDASSGGNSPSPLSRDRLGRGEELPQFLIHQAGLLFLINLLKTNRLTFSLNSWITLYQLFQKIAEEFSFSIESSLQELLVEISALTADEFYEQSSHPNVFVADIYEQLQQKLQRMNLWRLDWMLLDARVEVDGAYVHVYLDNSAVRLDLRMAGLDVNPDWIPWLGRVIYFHYGNYPELKISGAKS
jgi:hypothetical protein